MKFSLKKVLLLTVISFLTYNLYAQEKDSGLSFESTVQYGKQPNNLAILISNDYNGEGTLGAINSATWIDISQNFKLATDKEPLSSGNLNISKYQKDGKPLYIAFKYTGKASAKPSQRGWGIQNLTLKDKGVAKLFTPSDFKIMNHSDNHEGAGWSKSKSGIAFRSNQSLIASESWGIVKVQAGK